MPSLRIPVMGYFLAMHVFSTLYCINVVKVGLTYTFLAVSISSLALIILSSNLYISTIIDSNKAKTRDHVYLYSFLILPMTLSYYLPLFYYSQIIFSLSKIFPSLTLYLIYLSYNPTFSLFLYPQIIISSLFTFFTYYYVKKFKK